MPGTASPLTPGLGLKFLRDGHDSANLVAAPSLEGQPDNWNFLAHSFTTTLVSERPSSFVSQLVNARFATATKYVQAVGLQDVAARDQHGTRVETPRFPYLLRFQPVVDTTFPTKFGGYLQYVDQLANIPSDTRLFDVYAQDQPHATEHLLGTVHLVGNLRRSKWADERLFFRHQRKEADLAVCPMWKQSLPTYCSTLVPLY
jgi:hypothetical protein